MTAIELKKQLMSRIANIDDVSFLKAIKTILDSKAASQTLVLTKEQRSEIQESKNLLEQGFSIEQSDIDKKFDQWLNEK